MILLYNTCIPCYNEHYIVFFIGIIGTVAACVWGAISYKHRGPMSTSRYLMRLRVIAQSAVVGSIMVGVGLTMLRDRNDNKKN